MGVGVGVGDWNDSEVSTLIVVIAQWCFLAEYIYAQRNQLTACSFRNTYQWAAIRSKRNRTMRKYFYLSFHAALMECMKYYRLLSRNRRNAKYEQENKAANRKKMLHLLFVQLKLKSNFKLLTLKGNGYTQ